MKISISDNIRHYRRKNDWTQEELAAKLCVSVQVVSRWETGVSYPDLELIPVLANLFKVSADVLIGAEKSEDGSAPQKCYDRLNSLTEHSERLDYLREVHRDYPRDYSFLFFLVLESDSIKEKRAYAKELLAECTEESYRTQVIKEIVCAETDEELFREFLAKYTTPPELDRNVLLADRYTFRKEYGKAEPLKQLNAYHALTGKVFPNILPDHPQKKDVSASLYASKTRLEIINLLTAANGKSVVAGDGVPDMWFSERMRLGIRYVCHLAGSGKADEALTALEELTDLAEAFFSLPDGTELSFRCPTFSALTAKLRVSYAQSPFCGSDEVNLKRLLYSAQIAAVSGEKIPELNGGFGVKMLYPSVELMPFYQESGWEWFDPIRNDERFKSCVERLAKWDKSINKE